MIENNKFFMEVVKKIVIWTTTLKYYQNKNLGIESLVIT